MCLKLKNKILQVIEIISNYGLIFAIYKFILFIIKNLFRRLIFDIKHYRNDYRKIEARKKYLNYFQEKWEKTANKNDRMFYKLLEEDYKITCRKIKKNKRKNFSMKFTDCRQTRCWDHPSTIFPFKVKLYPKIS